MSPDETPFPTGWPAFELKGYRNHPQRKTYTNFSYESLPPLPADLFRGDFRWLVEQPSKQHSLFGTPYDCWAPQSAAEAPEKSAAVRQRASEHNLQIPAEYFRFMGDSALIRKIRSVTDCHFEPSARIAKCPLGEEGWFVHFLSDQQGCVHWNLYLPKGGGHCVVITEQYFGDSGYLDLEEEGYNEPAIVLFCALSFEEFIYRFWLENEIWYSINKPKKKWWWSSRVPAPLPAEQQKYVEHYRMLGGAP